MAEVVIETVGLTKDHVSPLLRRRFRAVDGLNLKVHQGETYGLLGLNGAGKTTTLKLLLGLLRPSCGKVSVLGHRAGDKTTLGRIGFLPENPYLYSYLTAFEFLDFSGQLFGLSAKVRKERAMELLTLVSMVEAKNIPVRKYSKGMLQRLAIAQCLINNPSLVFLDEPTSGLDPVGRRDVRKIIAGLKEKGTTVFFNSHLMPDINELCDRIGIMYRGKLVVEEKVKAITGGGGYQDLEEFFLATVSSAEQSRKMAQEIGG